MQNPLNGIVPNFSIFGAQFTAAWQKIGAGLWGVAILIAIFYLGRGVLAIATSNDNPGSRRIGQHEAARGAMALGGLVGLAVIVGAVIAVFGG